MFLKRLYKSLIGFITCTIVVVVIMLILWPTITDLPLLDLNTEVVTNHGAGGHFWLVLLMLLVVNIFLPIKIPSPIPQITEAEIANNFGNVGLYILILFIWLVGSFAGGLSSRGGLRSGMWASIISFLFLDLIFSSMTASLFSSIAGLSGFVLFLATFFFTLVIGSFLFVPILGLIGGIIGGILGKMLFRKKKEKIEETTDE
ncbi:MAG: hypothetical protein ACTSSG_05920 [Candidatus Heimdallarchaeaceae archaeon]